MSDALLEGTSPSRRDRKNPLLVVVTIVCLLIAGSVFVGGVWLYVAKAAKFAAERQRNTARLLVDQFLLSAHWRQLQGGAPEGQRFAPLIEDLTRRLTRQRHAAELIWPVAIDDARAPADDFEKRVVVSLRASQASDNMPADYTERAVPEDNLYQYYEAIRAQESCLVCHLSVPKDARVDLVPGKSLPQIAVEKEGEVLAIVKITIPMD